MIKTYVPETVFFMGKEYQGGIVQDVPEELASVISQHPIWSKAKPPKPVDPYSHLRSQSLQYLLGQITDFEADLKQRKHQIDIHLETGNQPPKNLLVTQENVLRSFAEFKAYALPLIEKKQAEEAARRARHIARGAEGGFVVRYDKDGNCTEEYVLEKIFVGAKK